MFHSPRRWLAVLTLASALLAATRSADAGELLAFDGILCSVTVAGSSIGLIEIGQRGTAINGYYAGGSFRGVARALGFTGTLYDKTAGAFGVWGYLDWDLVTLHGTAKGKDGHRYTLGGACALQTVQTCRLSTGLGTTKRVLKRGVRVSDRFPVVMVVRNYGEDALRRLAANFAAKFPAGTVFWTVTANEWVEDGTYDVATGAVSGRIRGLPRRGDRVRLAFVVSPPPGLAGKLMNISANAFKADAGVDDGDPQPARLYVHVLP